MIPKEMVNRYCSILVQGIATLELKISSVTDEEIVGVHDDGEEVHIAQKWVMVWWPDPKREHSKKLARERAAKATETRRRKTEIESETPVETV